MIALVFRYDARDPEEFEKAYAGVRLVGGDAEKILGKKINDVVLGDAAGILAAADALSAWEPGKLHNGQ